MNFKEIKRKIYRFRVPAGLIGVILILILAKPTFFSLIIGAVVSLFGFLLRAWAAGHIEKEKEIAISGPYRYVRHPLYIGNFILGTGLCISAYSLWSMLVFLIYFSIFYSVAITFETEKLKKLFPKEYNNYIKEVPCVLPCFKTNKGKSVKKFTFKLYKKNKEYRAILGGLVIWLILIIKYLVL